MSHQNLAYFLPIDVLLGPFLSLTPPRLGPTHRFSPTLKPCPLTTAGLAIAQATFFQNALTASALHAKGGQASAGSSLQASPAVPRTFAPQGPQFPATWRNKRSSGPCRLWGRQRPERVAMGFERVRRMRSGRGRRQGRARPWETLPPGPESL